MSNLDNCPHCGATLVGDPIPVEAREHYSPPYFYRREIGIEYPALYDGVWEWACPDCEFTWPSEVNLLRSKQS